jgi:hypothetical protein
MRGYLKLGDIKMDCPSILGAFAENRNVDIRSPNKLKMFSSKLVSCLNTNKVTIKGTINHKLIMKDNCKPMPQARSIGIIGIPRNMGGLMHARKVRFTFIYYLLYCYTVMQLCKKN